MIPKVYIDTSVVGGKFDSEFEFYTDLFFKEVEAGHYIIVLSNVLEAELTDSPQRVQEHYTYIAGFRSERIELSTEAIQLAELYISEGVVGITSRTDCRHIALATLHRADVLVSWNFKHIVNLKRIKGYNSINLREGYPTLEIRSPKELLEL